MHRRDVLAAIPALALLSALPAQAQSRPVAAAEASPGARAAITRSGNRFLLEVSGFNIGMPPTLGFNIGMPPTLQMGNFEIQDLFREPIYVGNLPQPLTLTLREGGQGRFEAGRQSGTLAYEVSSRRASGFLVVIAAAAAVLGRDLGRGGNGTVTFRGATHGFILEDQG